MNYEIYLFDKGNNSSLLRKLVSNIKNKNPVFTFNEVTRKTEAQSVILNNINTINSDNHQIIIDVVKKEEKIYKEGMDEPEFIHSHTIRILKNNFRKTIFCP